MSSKNNVSVPSGATISFTVTNVNAASTAIALGTLTAVSSTPAVATVALTAGGAGTLTTLTPGTTTITITDTQGGTVFTKVINLVVFDATKATSIVVKTASGVSI